MTYIGEVDSDMKDEFDNYIKNVAHRGFLKFDNENDFLDFNAFARVNCPNIDVERIKADNS